VLIRASVVGLTMIVAMLAQLPAAPFAPRMFAGGGHLMPYRLFIPKAVGPEGKLPLIVWLHGASGVGTDNNSQISAGGNEIGSRLWIRPDIQDKHPAFVVAPQAPPDQMWGETASNKLTAYGQLVIDLIDSLAREFPIDRDRVYLLGQSRGGIGVWDLVAKRPDVFAAAVPVCAIGDPKKIVAARDVRIWVFHGFKDIGMPVENARQMVAALKSAGGVVKYTEYPDLSHEIWTRAFAEPDLPEWLFAQRRSSGDCIGNCR
jgi:predicted peptidase